MDHVQLLCDDILILENGKQILYGNLNEIINSYLTKKIYLEADIPNKEINTLNDIDKIISIERINKCKIYIKVSSINVMPQIMEVLKNISIRDLSVNSINLNDIFLDKVGRFYEDE